MNMNICGIAQTLAAAAHQYSAKRVRLRRAARRAALAARAQINIK